MHFLTRHNYFYVLPAAVVGFIVVLALVIWLIGRAEAREAAERVAAATARQAEAEAQQALAERFVGGDQTAYAELANHNWMLAEPKTILGHLDRFITAKLTVPGDVEKWRAAVAALDDETAGTIRYNLFVLYSNNEAYGVADCLEAMAGISNAEMLAQTQAMLELKIQQLTEAASQGSPESFTSLRELRDRYRTGLRSLRAQMLPPWDDLVVKFIDDPVYNDFDHRGREYASGEPRRRTAEALEREDVTGAVRLLAYHDAHQHKTGSPFHIPQYMVAQLAQMVARLKGQETTANAQAVELAKHD